MREIRADMRLKEAIMSNINIETLVREAVKAALAGIVGEVETPLTQQVTQTCTETAASTGKACKRPATHGDVCGLHTPERLGKVKPNTFFTDVIVPRASKKAVNVKAADIAQEFGFSRSGPEWRYVRDGLVAGKDEAVLRDALKG